MVISLHTPRLVLRPLMLHDLHLVHILHSMPETDYYNTLGIPEGQHVTQGIIQEWLQNQNGASYTYIIELNSNHMFIGIISLSNSQNKWSRGEVWYKLHKEHWCKGYATEALKEIIKFGFEGLRMHRIEAGCAVDNIASAKVLEKAGMQLEGTKRKVLPIRGHWYDALSYAILEEDYFPAKDNVE